MARAYAEESAVDEAVYRLDDLACHLNVEVADLVLVAQIELCLDEWDEEAGVVTTAGRDALVTHFMGGEDPTG